MQFYTKTHPYYCGIDLHTKTMYVCILNNEGEIVLHQNIKSQAEPFIELIAQYRQQLIVGIVLLTHHECDHSQPSLYLHAPGYVVLSMHQSRLRISLHHHL